MPEPTADPGGTVLYVHAGAPPEGGGTPVLLHRLLSGLPPERLITVADRSLRDRVVSGSGRILPGRYAFVPRKGLRGNRWAVGRAVNEVVNLLLAVSAGVKAGRIARRQGADWVLTVSDDGFSPIAAAIAARRARRPLVIMVFDLWSENAYTGPERFVGRVLEGRLWRGAARVVVHCHEMAAHYRAKHGIEPIVLPTPVDLGDLPGPATAPREIVFGGAVYWAQEDALRRLSDATLRTPEAELTVIGSWADEATLAELGISADNLVPELAQDDYRRRVREAGALFVGLSFDSPHPDVVRTAAPAKFSEYMAAGRPMLVHAPRGSHVAEYARAHDVAEVVDEPDVERLSSALRSVLGDGERVVARVERARALAAERHETGRVRRRFADLLRGLRTQ